MTFPINKILFVCSDFHAQTVKYFLLFFRTDKCARIINLRLIGSQTIELNETRHRLYMRQTVALTTCVILEFECYFLLEE